MGNIGAMVYAIIVMALVLLINLLMSKLLNVDIYILFFSNIIVILSMIWYSMDKEA